MKKETKSNKNILLREILQLRNKLAECEETLQAIRHGQVDAIVVSGPKERVFTLEGAEHPYRIFVESMNEGAATLTSDTTIVITEKPSLFIDESN